MVFIDEASCEAKCQAVQDCFDNAPNAVDCFVNNDCDDGSCEAEIEDAEGSNCNCDFGFDMEDANEGEGKFSETK